MMREALVVAFGRLVNAAVALGGFAVMTRLLPPAEYTLVAILTAFAMFAGLILINPSGQWALRHLHEWHKDGVLNHVMSECLRYWWIMAVLVGAVAGIWYSLVQGHNEGLALAIFVTVAAFIVFSNAAQIFGALLNALGYRVPSVAWSVTATALPILGAAGGVFVHADALYWFGGQALGAALAFAGVKYASKKLLPKNTPYQSSVPQKAFYRQREYWRFALPLTAVTAFLWIEGNGYRFLLERFWSPETLGVFLIALSVPAQMTAVMESFVFQYAYPYFFRNLAGTDDHDTQAQVTSAMTSALLPLYWIWGGFLLLMAPQFLFLVAGEAYHGAAQWIVFGALLEVARLTGNAWSVSALARKDYQPMMAPFAIGAGGSLIAAWTVGEGDLPVWLFGLVLVLVAVFKTMGIVIQARRVLPVTIGIRRTSLAFAVLLAGLAGHTWMTEYHGPEIAVAVLGIAGCTAVALGYLHLRTAAGFQQLLKVGLR